MTDPIERWKADAAASHVPDRVRYGGPRAVFSATDNDPFSEEENPSYRSMAEMFAPEPPPVRRPRQDNQAAKMLLRLGGVVVLAGVAVALFAGYMTTQKGRAGAALDRAVSAVQAVASPSFQPSLPEPADLEKVPVVTAKLAEPEPLTAPAAEVASDRGAAPAPPPAEEKAKPEEPTKSAAQVAAVTPDPAPAPARAAPPPPPAAPVPQLSPGDLATLMARGRRFVESGDFSSARPVYRRAAEAGYAEAALALGETYDPVTLAERGAIGMNPNVAQARRWYERARELGSLEAPTRLKRLPRP